MAKICMNYGYEKLYFALPLKQLCAKLLGMSVDELNKLKNNGTDISFEMTKCICDAVGMETRIPYSDVMACCLGKTMKNVREMLQQIGTNLIRTYNYNLTYYNIINIADSKL